VNRFVPEKAEWALRTIIYTFIYIICIFICGGSAPARSVSRDDKIPADEEAGENGDRFLVSAALLGLFFSLTRASLRIVPSWFTFLPRTCGYF